MSDEHIRLVAKIQHFYEIMLAKNSQILDEAIAGKSLDMKVSTVVASEISALLTEYEKAFESFLYKHNGDTQSM